MCGTEPVLRPCLPGPVLFTVCSAGCEGQQASRAGQVGGPWQSLPHAHAHTCLTLASMHALPHAHSRERLGIHLPKPNRERAPMGAWGQTRAAPDPPGP